MTDRAEIERLLINGRTPEEIKCGLRCGVTGEHECSECAYYGRIDEETGLRNFDCSEIDRDALAYIERLEAQQPEWISVKERLPERHGQLCVGLYTLHGGDKSMLSPYIFTWHAYGDNGYVNGPHFSDEGLDGLKVYYWMPLPEPPEEEGDATD